MGDDRGHLARQRVSDSDRDDAVAELRRHLGEGRLDADELSERVEGALAARTRADLEAVLADLPSASPPAPDGPRPHATGWTVGIMASSVRRGRWRPRPRTNVVSVMGSCTIDLRQAYLDGPELVIHAVAVMGEVEIVVPEGIDVDVSGIPILGEKSLDVRPGPLRPGTPRVLVRAVPVMGSVVVRSRQAPGAEGDRRTVGPGPAHGPGRAALDRAAGEP
ncbi:MAG: DUF1707 and DUF2154 domain-containing protein [Acidimicrobiales bacterium]|nr:DUF1707 and DUF2154 domain-containing protein [Acidimicrobiales bacterium]MBO0893154.1 DUF1707 and DUF2154 domain-containing protein [Acidimicrobiales bacterium]